jgi:HK97 gp10 family phage protein
MSSSSVTITGMDDLVKKLQQLGKVTADLKDDAVKAMTEVKFAARRHAPVNRGPLRQNINVKNLTEGDELRVGCGIFAEAGINYAVYVEYGTGIYAENGMGRQTPWVAPIITDNEGQIFRWMVGVHPHPFMRPAWDEEKENVANHMKAAIIKKLETL